MGCVEACLETGFSCYKHKWCEFGCGSPIGARNAVGFNMLLWKKGIQNGGFGQLGNIKPINSEM
jgi:hypothetical protein